MMDSFRYYRSHAAGYQVIPKKAPLDYEIKYSDQNEVKGFRTDEVAKTLAS